MGELNSMKTFAAALLCISAYGSQIEASTQVTTGATAEIESVIGGYSSSLAYGNAYSQSYGIRGVYTGGHIYSDSYTSDYSLSDYSDSDYGYGYRRYAGRVRYFRYRPRYYSNRYYYGRRYASRLGVYNGQYRSYGYRSYGYGYQGRYNGLRRYGGAYYW